MKNCSSHGDLPDCPFIIVLLLLSSDSCILNHAIIELHCESNMLSFVVLHYYDWRHVSTIKYGPLTLIEWCRTSSRTIHPHIVAAGSNSKSDGVINLIINSISSSLSPDQFHSFTYWCWSAQYPPKMWSPGLVFEEDNIQLVVRPGGSYEQFWATGWPSHLINSNLNAQKGNFADPCGSALSRSTIRLCFVSMGNLTLLALEQLDFDGT